MKKNEAIDVIYDIIYNELEKNGFKASKNKCFWQRNTKRHKDEICILLHQQGEFVSQHIRIEVTDKIVSAEVKRIEELVRKKNNLSSLKIRRATCVVSDWKEILSNSDNVTWLTKYQSESSIRNEAENYIELIKVAINWFDEIKDPAKMMQHLLSSGLTMSLATYLIVKKINSEDIKSSYEYILDVMSKKKSWDKIELNEFYECL